MKTFKLENGDRIITNGVAETISNGECLAQRLKNAIRLDKSSWFLSPDKGVEWLEIFGSKSVSARAIYTKIRDILEADSEVSSINSLDISFDRSERNMSVAFSVNSIYGEVEGTV